MIVSQHSERIGKMSDVSGVELRKLQLATLKMAKYFVKFCNENNLLCYFCGGGCIGAIRHGGFIPWDDDLDFFMPREDYEKLTILWKEKGDKENYALNRPDRDFQDRNSFITLRDKNTTQIKTYQTDLDIVHGIVLDIFPIDGYPDSGFKRKLQCVDAMIFSLFCTGMVPSKHGKMLEYGSKFLLKLFSGKNIRYKIWKGAERRMSKYKIQDCKGITELCAGPGYMKNWYPKEAFESAEYHDFEDCKMPIPVGYDSYLKIAFGDYMKLPPKEKQVPAHDCVLIDTENSYIKYKNKFYCKE